MLPEVRVAVHKNLENHEGRVLAIYPDSEVIPTCGVGHALFTPVDAYKITFWRASGILATRDEILKAWTAVKYGGLKRALMMAYDETERVLNEDLDYFEKIVKLAFPGVDSYPQSVQVAIYDIAVNTGSFRKWPRFSAAILARDFVTAAKESNRPQVSETRNADTYKQLTVI